MTKTFLEIALACAVRGWHVFPCKPGTKEPMTLHAYKDASNDEAQIRAWWTRAPNANIAIATGASRLTVWDCDHGLGSYEGFQAFRAEHNIPETYTVRTGRRDDYGVQAYFTDPDGMKSIGWGEGAHAGDIRSATGYVMAAGSIHPDTGERYEVLTNAPLAETPDFLRKLTARQLPTRLGERNEPITDDGGPIEEHRNVHMISLLGRKRAEGADDDAILEFALDVNEKRMTPPLGEMELERLVQNACKYPIGEPDPVVLIGGKTACAPVVPKEQIDWRTRYMTEGAYLNVKPPEFLIDGFLVKKSIAMLAGPVAQRKSIIALNIAHALCTGEPLFGYFHVTVCPERVLYLCPEMGAASFVKRIKQIGLGKFMGKTLFVQTMSEQQTTLDELEDELPGAVVVVDTITRFIEGDENKSEDMRKFAAKVFRLMNAGATIVLLHHSKKGSSGSLDDGLRGSSELAAFVDSCWVTELEDPKQPYTSLSKMRNVKQRDFESDPFKLKPSPGSYYLSMNGDPEPEAVVKSKADGLARDALRKLLAVDPKMGINRLRDALMAAGHKRGTKWVTMARVDLSSSGVTHTQ